MARALDRVKAIKLGDPRDPETMMGAEASNDQKEKILTYLEIGKPEGAQVLTGDAHTDLGGDLSGGYYFQPTIFRGHNKMRIFRRRSSVPWCR